MRKILLTAGIIIVIGLAVMIAIDANKISGLKLDKISDAEYHATFKNSAGNYFVKYVPKESIYPYFGEAHGNSTAVVRSDLPRDAKDFVTRHELYHLQDSQHKNVISREIHANLAPIPYRPLGFIETIFLTLTNKDRMSYYFKLIF